MARAGRPRPVGIDVTIGDREYSRAEFDDVCFRRSRYTLHEMLRLGAAVLDTDSHPLSDGEIDAVPDARIRGVLLEMEPDHIDVGATHVTEIMGMYGRPTQMKASLGVQAPIPVTTDHPWRLIGASHLAGDRNLINAIAVHQVRPGRGPSTWWPMRNGCAPSRRVSPSPRPAVS